MRSMCKWVVAAILSCAAFVCPADDMMPMGEYLMYWMVDYSPSEKTAAINGELADKMPDYTASDVNYAKLIALIDGSDKIVVDASNLSGLKAGTASVIDPGAMVVDLGLLDAAVNSKPVTSFWVEFYNASGETQTLLGWSESIRPETLAAQGAIADFREEKYPDASYGSWSPSSFTAVPEPTSGLLILVGGALLALRRRRRAAGNVEG